MVNEYCADCGHKFENGQMRIYWKGKDRCEKCDRIFKEKESKSKEKKINL